MRPNPASDKFFSAGWRDRLRTKTAFLSAYRTTEFPNATRCPRACNVVQTGAARIDYRVLRLADMFVDMWPTPGARHLGSADGGRTDKHDASEVHFGHVRKTGPSSPQLSTRHGYDALGLTGGREQNVMTYLPVVPRDWSGDG
jgi:hypothetical protein